MMTALSRVNDAPKMGGMDTSLGSYIRARRVDLGLSQTDLAERAGLPRAHLSEIERGKIGLPNAGVRRNVASVLGVSHIEMLIAAGEISAEEVAAPSPPSELDTLFARLSPTLRAAQLVVLRELAGDGVARQTPEPQQRTG